MIEVSNLVKSMTSYWVADHLSFQIEKGKNLRIPGPNGRKINNYEHDHRIHCFHRRKSDDRWS